ncbi:DsbA family protein [Thioclava sp. GXIMD4216]|uniref:DsbA family protein n=1 Tax=Thioclava litoralis TaxID=3076557 RepID=A0ABZ1E2T8_9RHOB|nr:DsbA family protein [Thioclava sp. FTW29]
MNRRSFLLGISGAAVVAALGGWISSRGESLMTGFATPASAEDAKPDATVETLPDIPIGSADAPVTIIEYASFTCPHCAHWHETSWANLKKEYIDTGKVRFIMREVYFDKFGLWAGLLAQCGGDMKYYSVADMIFDGQQDWIGDGQQATIAANLRKLGLKAGFSKEQIETCLNDQNRARQMVATFQKNANADAIDGTPTFIINGKKYSNMAWDKFKEAVDEALKG